MKRIKITKDVKDNILKDFKKYLETLEPGKKIEYSYKEDAVTGSKPKVILSQTAYIKIKTLVSNCDGEVGWNGTVERTDNTFYVKDIYVYPQTVTAATVTCDELETAQWLMKLPTDVFNTLRFQAHSHVNMGISPSGVDTTMYEKYLINLAENDFYIFMIFNKKDDYYIEINDNKTNCIYYKNDIDLEIEGAKEFWNNIKDNIKKPVYQQTQPQQTNSPKSENTTPVIQECQKNTCKDCEKFDECAREWYTKKLKELKK